MNPPAPSPEHLAQLDTARQTAKKIRRAVVVANIDGWTIAAFAAITLVASLTSLSGILLGAGMGYVAWRELSCGAALRRLDGGAARRLAINQLVLSGVLILYFAWCLYEAINGSNDLSELITSSPEAAGNVGNIDHLMRLISVWIYVGLMAGSLIVQGLTAWYYLSRAKLVDEYVATTPQWIVDYQRGGGTI